MFYIFKYKLLFYKNNNFQKLFLKNNYQKDIRAPLFFQINFKKRKINFYLFYY